MNPRQVGVLFKNLSIFISGGVPVLLRLEGFRFKFVGLIGSRSDVSHFLSRPRSKLREVVRHNVEDFGICRKVALEDPQSIDGSLSLIKAPGATRRRHRGTVLQLLVRHTGNRTLQYGKRLRTPPLGGEVDRTLNGGSSSFWGLFCSLGCEETGRQNHGQRNLQREANQFNHNSAI